MFTDDAPDDALARCSACGAAQELGVTHCLECDEPLVFVTERGRRIIRAAAWLAYNDDSFAPRRCDRCQTEYRGPAVYCSLECAIADA